MSLCDLCVLCGEMFGFNIQHSIFDIGMPFGGGCQLRVAGGLLKERANRRLRPATPFGAGTVEQLVLVLLDDRERFARPARCATPSGAPRAHRALGVNDALSVTA